MSTFSFMGEDAIKWIFNAGANEINMTQKDPTIIDISKENYEVVEEDEESEEK